MTRFRVFMIFKKNNIFFSQNFALFCLFNLQLQEMKRQRENSIVEKPINFLQDMSCKPVLFSFLSTRDFYCLTLTNQHFHNFTSELKKRKIWTIAELNDNQLSVRAIVVRDTFGPLSKCLRHLKTCHIENNREPLYVEFQDEELPCSLESIECSCVLSHITTLPSNLKSLSLKSYVVFLIPKLHEFPTSLTSLNMGCRFDCFESYGLPESLITLNLQFDKLPYLNAGMLPSKLQHLRLTSREHDDFPIFFAKDCFPPSLLSLTLDLSIESTEILFLPSTLKTLNVNHHTSISFPETLCELVCCGCETFLSRCSSLPSSLTSLKLQRSHNCAIPGLIRNILPHVHTFQCNGTFDLQMFPNLQRFAIENVQSPVVITHQLKTLKLTDCNAYVSLPSSLQFLNVVDSHIPIISNIKSLTHLKLDSVFHFFDQKWLPPNVKILHLFTNVFNLWLDFIPKSTQVLIIEGGFPAIIRQRLPQSILYLAVDAKNFYSVIQHLPPKLLILYVKEMSLTTARNNCSFSNIQIWDNWIVDVANTDFDTFQIK